VQDEKLYRDNLRLRRLLKKGPQAPLGSRPGGYRLRRAPRTFPAGNAGAG
jgi:hypothetical protein